MSIDPTQNPPSAPRVAELAQLIEAAAAGRKPPIEAWNPTKTADIGLKVTADGVWHYQGSPILRPAIVKVFASIMRREPGGHYLVTPTEKVLVAVEDAPLLAVEMWAEGAGRGQALSFRTNLDDVVLAGPEHAMRFEADPVTEAPKPYLAVRHGLEALATRPVYLELVELGAIEEEGGVASFGLWSRGRFFAMSPAEALE